MVKMRPPRVPVQPPPVVAGDDLARLLKACETPRQDKYRPKGQPTDRATFENERDKALILLLSSTGIHAGELMGLTHEDVDLTNGTFVVVGKGGKHRIVALMPGAAEAVDRYLRATSQASESSPAKPVAERQGRTDDLWPGADGHPPMRRRQYPEDQPAPVPAHVRP